MLEKEKNLSIFWIDYQTAFESVPHSCVDKSIEMVGLSNKIVNYQQRNGEM